MPSNNFSQIRIIKQHIICQLKLIAVHNSKSGPFENRRVSTVCPLFPSSEGTARDLHHLAMLNSLLGRSFASVLAPYANPTDEIVNALHNRDTSHALEILQSTPIQDLELGILYDGNDFNFPNNFECMRLLDDGRRGLVAVRFASSSSAIIPPAIDSKLRIAMR